MEKISNGLAVLLFACLANMGQNKNLNEPDTTPAVIQQISYSESKPYKPREFEIPVTDTKVGEKKKNSLQHYSIEIC